MSKSIVGIVFFVVGSVVAMDSKVVPASPTFRRIQKDLTVAQEACGSGDFQKAKQQLDVVEKCMANHFNRCERRGKVVDKEALEVSLILWTLWLQAIETECEDSCLCLESPEELGFIGAKRVLDERGDVTSGSSSSDDESLSKYI